MNRSLRNQKISGWGHFPVASCDIFRPEKIADLDHITGPVVARGLGRSYGDAALNEKGAVISMEKLARFLDFNEKTGMLRAEAGVSIEAVLDTFVPKGWFVPVTPGTQHVTLGGCFACDIHGKNHHRDGAFSAYVSELVINLACGERKTCSPWKEEQLFWATAGGMGLTGVISEMSLQMIPIQTPFMIVQNHATRNLENTLELLSDPIVDDRYSVAWIDCLAKGNQMGRGVIMNGHHASREELSANLDPFLNYTKRQSHHIPSFIPSLFLNPTTINLFNKMYYLFNSRQNERHEVDLYSYFYPLDSIRAWNSFYGKTGFIQYQFVVPKEKGEKAISAVLQGLVKKQITPFLAVLKRFGPKGKGYLSFPIEGFTLALDIPMKSGIANMMKDFDDLLIAWGGRVYLAKDAILQPDSFRAMYPDFPQWREVKNQVDPSWTFSSSLSRRLKMEQSYQ